MSDTARTYAQLLAETKEQAAEIERLTAEMVSRGNRLAETLSNEAFLEAEIERLTAALERSRQPCPAHGMAACPEEYMLGESGRPYGSYEAIWHEEMRCGQRPAAEIERLTVALAPCRTTANRVGTLTPGTDSR